MSGTRTVAYVANTDWYLYNFRLDLLRAAEDAGWTPLLICPAGQYAQRLRALGYRVETLALENAGINPLRELRVLLGLCRLVRHNHPRVLHLFTLKCVLYGAIAALFTRGTRAVAAVTGMGYLFTSTGWRVRLLKTPFLAALRLVLRYSGARVVFQNTYDRDEFVARKLIAMERSHVIRGSGVDCRRFCPDAAPASRASNAPVLLFASRLLREKGVYEYIDATAMLRAEGLAFASLIAGDSYPGNPSSLSETEIESLRRDPHHRYLGHRDDMPELLAAADIVVLPTYREGTPKILLEAAAMARLIVTTDIPGCRGLVEDGVTGYLVRPRHTRALADGLRRALACSPEQRRQMGRAGRAIVQSQFSNAAVNEATLAVYEQGDS